MRYQSFEDIKVRQKAMDLAVEIFLLTGSLPRKEDYGLTSQIRRSALSVATNLAEGFGRRHTDNKLNFYYDSRGSLAETNSHLIYGRRVGYFREEKCKGLIKLIEEIWKELNYLIAALQRDGE
jgi:four helix bundle protein